VAGFCEHGNEPLGFLRKQILLDRLSDNQLFEEYPAPWSKYLKRTLVPS